jgi:hypothetical protein
MIKYNEPIEVTKEQKDKLTTVLSGVIAHRTDENGKHWIKCLLMRYSETIEKFLKS